MVLTVDSSNFAEEVLRADKTVVVDFFATWCPPCQRLAPVFESVAGELQDLKFVKIDIDDCNDLAVEWGISAIPTLVIFKAGKMVAKEVPHGFDLASLKAQLGRFIA